MHSYDNYVWLLRDYLASPLTRFVSYSVSLVTEELGMEVTNEDTNDWLVKIISNIIIYSGHSVRLLRQASHLVSRTNHDSTPKIYISIRQPPLYYLHVHLLILAHG